MISDLRIALRHLGRSPLHSAMIILILAIGIGANAAIFSLVHAILLKPLPYPDAERVMFLMQRQRGSMDSPFSWPNLQDLIRDNRVFASVGAYARRTMTVSGRGPAEQSRGTAASADFFQVLGLQPLLGRVYTAADDRPGGPRVVVLHESFWRRKLGGDPAIIGQFLTINAQPHEIIGVMPAAAVSPSGTDFWLPIAPLADNDGWRNRRNQPGIFALARLKPGLTLAQAEADLLALGQRLQRDFPEANSDIVPVVRPLLRVLTDQHRSSLGVLSAAVGLLLLIACANVASLQAVRGLARMPELSVRAALGARRGSLARMLFLESLLLSLFGGVLGILLAVWSFDGIRLLMPPTPRLAGLAIDGVVLAFSVGLALVTSILAGLWPAWRASRVDLREALQTGAQKGGTGSSQFARQLMVALQVSLTVVLLSGAALFTRSLREIARFEYGFDSSNLLLVAASVPDTPGAYDTDGKRIAFFENVRARVAALPGVRTVGLNYSAPLRMDWSTVFDIEGRPAFAPGQEPAMGMGIIDAHYFEALGLPILRGRNFDSRDKLGGPRGIIIDQRMAETFWPGEDPIGKTILRGNPINRTPEQRRAVVIGVVPTVQVDGFAEGTRFFQGYLAQSQTGSEQMNLVIRTTVEPRSLVDSVRAAIAEVDPNVPAYGIATMEELIRQESGSQRLYAVLTLLFASVALLLSALGLYGIVAQSVGARRRELGIRMALGAVPRQIVRLVMHEGLAPLVVGLALGLLGALLGGRLISGLLYRVSPFDLPALLAATIVLVAVSFAALWLPARRTTRIDPALALRTE